MITYVYTTLASDTQYTKWAKVPVGALPRVEGKVVIKGGAGVADRRLVTPKGVATVVSDEDLAILEGSPMFARHKERGFVTVSKSKADADEVAADLTGRDTSAPLVPQDFADDKEPDAGRSNKRGRA